MHLYLTDLLYNESKLLDKKQIYVNNALIYQHTFINFLIQHTYETRRKQQANLEVQKFNKRAYNI